MQETSEILFSSSTVPRHFTNAGRTRVDLPTATAAIGSRTSAERLGRCCPATTAPEKCRRTIFQVRELDPMPRYCSLVSWHVLSTCHDCSISWNRVCLTLFSSDAVLPSLIHREIGDADQKTR